MARARVQRGRPASDQHGDDAKIVAVVVVVVAVAEARDYHPLLHHSTTQYPRGIELGSPGRWTRAPPPWWSPPAVATATTATFQLHLTHKLANPEQDEGRAALPAR